MNTKQFFKKMVKMKRFKYLSIAILVMLVGVIFNATFASFISGNTSEFINTKVSDLEYSFTINEKQTTILEIDANQEKAFDLNVKSLEDNETKYEIIYDVCKTEICREFVTRPQGLSVSYSAKTKEPVLGIADGNEVRTIRLVVSNNTSQKQYLKFDANLGFVHNTLTLRNDIINEHEDNFLMTNIISEYGGLANLIETQISTFENVSVVNENKLYKTTDDLGVSYYFRGDKSKINNNLIFAEAKWKIVRINGDESIRIIYNGVCPDNECNLNAEILENESPFNEIDNLNIYNGYMYENDESEINSSTIKTNLDLWYEENIKVEYRENIYNTLFCNDRDVNIEDGRTIYKSRLRLDINKMPTLKCNLEKDRFKVEEGSLKHKIGLLTADEAAFAGLKYNTSNNTNYLTVNYNWWTLTPYDFDEIATNMYITNTGELNNSSVQTPYQIRPVINLKPGIKVSGEGSETNPYIVI